MPRNLYKKGKILSPRLYPFREIAWFNMASPRSKVGLAPPMGKVCDIQDDCANSTLTLGIKAYNIKSNVIVTIKIVFQKFAWWEKELNKKKGITSTLVDRYLWVSLCSVLKQQQYVTYLPSHFYLIHFIYKISSIHFM